MGYDTFWTIFLQTHLVTLKGSNFGTFSESMNTMYIYTGVFK
jgi:hypothetical protein